MELMEASVYVGDGVLEVQDVAGPEPGPGEVLIEIAQCGICGTDLHLVLERIARPGTVLGHEWAGTIAATGDGVEGWSVGAAGRVRPRARVRRMPGLPRRPTVGVPAPPADRPPLVPRRVRPVRRRTGRPAGRGARPAAVRAAALTEPTAVALHAVTLSGVTPDDRVLVTGAGPVGLLVTAVLHAQGVHDVTVSEPAPARRERALQVGAARAVTPDALPKPSMGSPVAEPYTVVFECSGRADAGEAAIDQLDFAGTCVLVGTGHEFPRLNHNRVIVLENTIIGSYNYDAGGLRAALELLASGRMPLDELIEPVDVLLDELLPRDAALRRRRAAGQGDGPTEDEPRREEERSDECRSPSFAPRLNHVAMTMSPDSLDEHGRAEIRDFYGDVFGWSEGDNSGETGNPLIMMTGEVMQFVYLLPGDPVLACPTLDHFGLRCRRWRRSRPSWPRPRRGRRRTTGSRSSTRRRARRKDRVATTCSRARTSGTSCR